MSRPFALSTLSFWRSYWITCRPYLFFVSGVSGLVGLAIPEQVGWGRFALAFCAFFFTYGLGQALTDVFQIDTDSISSPYRPLTQGLISRGQVLAVSLVGLVLCAAVFFACNPWTLALSALGIAGLASYTPFKRRWWAGPFWNSWIVALLPALGCLCAEADPRSVFSRPILWAVMGSVFFSYAVFVLLGYFKDISADRATGYQTMVVRFGWEKSVLLSSGFALSGILSSIAVFSLSGFRSTPAWFLWVAGVLITIYAHLAMLGTRRESQAHRPIAHVVRGYLLLHLGEAVALKPVLALPASIFYMVFEATLLLRPERSQV